MSAWSDLKRLLSRICNSCNNEKIHRHPLRARTVFKIKIPIKPQKWTQLRNEFSRKYDRMGKMQNSCKRMFGELFGRVIKDERVKKTPKTRVGT